MKHGNKAELYHERQQNSVSFSLGLPAVSEVSLAVSEVRWKDMESSGIYLWLRRSQSDKSWLTAAVKYPTKI